MNKKEAETLTSIVEDLIHQQGGFVKIQKEFLESQERILNVIIKIVNIINVLEQKLKYIMFIILMIVWRVYLWDVMYKLLNSIINKWGVLSETYKILILSFIGAIIAGIIANILASLFLEKIKQILKGTK